MLPCLATIFLIHLSYYDVKGEPRKDQDLTNHKGHNKPFGESGVKVDIDSVEGFPDFVPFYEDYIVDSKPLVMKGAVTLFPAFKKWNDGYLKSMATAWQGEKIELLCETLKKENRSRMGRFMKLEDFLDVYNQSDLYAVDTVPPYLDHDVVLPCPVQCMEVRNTFLDTLMWFSSGGTSSVIHLDSYDNINCLYRGNKTFTLLPRYKRSRMIPIDTDGSSKLDVDKIDLVNNPSLADATFYVTSMVPGDCLYIPYMWLHQARSYGSNLAVNYWWEHYTTRARVDYGACYSHTGCDTEFTVGKLREELANSVNRPDDSQQVTTPNLDYAREVMWKLNRIPQKTASTSSFPELVMQSPEKNVEKSGMVNEALGVQQRSRRGRNFDRIFYLRN